MMKRSYVARSLFGLLLLVCPPMLVQCGGAAEEPGTETGNPPHVEERKLYLVESARGVELIGDAGAVSPQRATVQVTNLRTGERVETTAQGDGSVRVVVPGTLQDEYEVTVSNGSATASARASAGSANGDAAIGALTCEELENGLSQSVASGFMLGDTACVTDTDCVYAGWGASCYYQCGASFLSVAGEAAARATVELSTAPFCAELANRCLRQPASSCPPDLVRTPVCNQGTCQGLDVDALECPELTSRARLRRRELLDGGDRSCSSNADCAVANPTLSCVSDCGNQTPVARADQARLEGSVARVERDFCQNFTSRGCPPDPIPPCDPEGPATAVCDAGQCSLLFGL